jgi:hypothetical protein
MLQFSHLPMSLVLEIRRNATIGYQRTMQWAESGLPQITCHTGFPMLYSQFYCTSDWSEGTEYHPLDDIGNMIFMPNRKR